MSEKVGIRRWNAMDGACSVCNESPAAVTTRSPGGSQFRACASCLGAMVRAAEGPRAGEGRLDLLAADLSSLRAEFEALRDGLAAAARGRGL